MRTRCSLTELHEFCFVCLSPELWLTREFPPTLPTDRSALGGVAFPLGPGRYTSAAGLTQTETVDECS